MTEIATGSRGWTGVLSRWPTGLAVAVAGLVSLAMGEDVAEEVPSFSAVMLILPLLYLIVAGLGRREATWPVLGGLLVVTVALSEHDPVLRATVYTAVALVVLIWTTVDRRLVRSGELQIQTGGLAAFGAFAVVGLAIDPDLGRYVVAAGWLLHGIWDFVHLSRDKVVQRSFAEWCGVVDILVAAQLLFLL
jgi:hypothetical protein